jgi:hypothetical protein
MNNVENALAALYVVATYLANGSVRLVTLGLRPVIFGLNSTDVPADLVAATVNDIAVEAARYHTAVYFAVVPEGYRYHASWEKQNRHECVNSATGEALEIAGDLVFVA